MCRFVSVMAETAPNSVSGCIRVCAVLECVYTQMHGSTYIFYSVTLMSLY